MQNSQMEMATATHVETPRQMRRAVFMKILLAVLRHMFEINKKKTGQLRLANVRKGIRWYKNIIAYSSDLVNCRMWTKYEFFEKPCLTY